MSVFGGGGGGFGGGSHELPGVELNLTALMDILSNLLFFLLASYTTQSLEIQQKPGLHLPASSSQLKPTPDLTVSVTDSTIFVDDVPVAKVDGDKLSGTTLDGEKIVSLYDRLHTVQQAHAASGTDDEVHGGDLVMVLCDKNTDSQIVAKVLKTAAMAGFVKARFGVLAN
jgi:biopolymer transport protein ExbD